MISKDELRNCLLKADIPVEKVDVFMKKSNKEIYDRGNLKGIEKKLMIMKEHGLIDAMLQNSPSVLARR